MCVDPCASGTWPARSCWPAGADDSDEIFLWDREANDHARAHVKIAWPFQLTLAHPDQKNVQLALYSDHFSGGGGLFDIGGFDAFGLGLRLTF